MEKYVGKEVVCEYSHGYVDIAPVMELLTMKDIILGVEREYFRLQPGNRFLPCSMVSEVKTEMLHNTSQDNQHELTRTWKMTIRTDENVRFDKN